MATETGRVSNAREPLLSVRLGGRLTVECLVDTGFSGALMLPGQIVSDLAIPIIGREVFEMVGGRFFSAAIALAEFDWLGQRQAARVVVSDGSDSLLGAEMLDGRRLIIDYLNNTVILTDESARQF